MSSMLLLRTSHSLWGSFPLLLWLFVGFSNLLAGNLALFCRWFGNRGSLSSSALPWPSRQASQPDTCIYDLQPCESLLSVSLRQVALRKTPHLHTTHAHTNSKDNALRVVATSCHFLHAATALSVSW